MNKLKAFWASLPHQVQAAIIFGGSATLESVGHAISNGKLPQTWPDFQRFIIGALTTGATAAWAFYRVPNRAVPPTPPQPAMPYQP
jgi:hypothetical protein